jgi:hypothetical protein
MIVAKRRRSPRAQNYRTGVWSGLGSINSQGGWNPDPVPAPASYETCSAVDSACTARNLTKNIAHEQAVAIALYGHDGDGNGPLGYLDKTKNPYLGPAPAAPSTPLASANVAPFNPPVVSLPALQPLGPLASNEIQPGSNVTFPASAPLVVTSSGVPTPAATVPASTGFDFSAVPWYVWAGGAVAAFSLIGGQSGR